VWVRAGSKLLTAMEYDADSNRHQSPDGIHAGSQYLSMPYRKQVISLTPEWSEVSQKDWIDYISSDMGQIVRAVLDPLMLEQIRPQGKVLLDIGCGEGYFARVLKAAGAARVVGADISPALIKKAQEQDPDGEYQVFDIASGPLSPPGGFDAVSACMVLMDLPDLDIAYRNISASLAPSGHLIACMINPYYAFPVGEWRWALRDGLHHVFDPRHRTPKRFVRQVHGVLLGEFDWILYIGNYFERRVVEKMLGNAATLHFHKPFSDYVNLAAKHGLVLQLLLEPQISGELHERYAHEPLARALTTVPLFFVLVFAKVSQL